MAKNDCRLTFDTKDFDLKFGKIAIEIPKHGGQKLWEISPQVHRWAIKEIPRTPHKTGHLWRSWKAEFKIKLQEFILYIGFNVPYAAKLHEGPSNWNWTLPGSGPKYLSSKLMKHAKEIFKEVAEYIKSKQK